MKFNFPFDVTRFSNGKSYLLGERLGKHTPAGPRRLEYDFKID